MFTSHSGMWNALLFNEAQDRDIMQKILRRTKPNQDNNRSERQWLPHLHIYWSHASNHDRCYVFKYYDEIWKKGGQRKSMRCYYSLSFIASCPQLYTLGISVIRGSTHLTFPILSSIHFNAFMCKKPLKASGTWFGADNTLFILWFTPPLFSPTHYLILKNTSECMTLGCFHLSSFTYTLNLVSFGALFCS